jgi:hypothetical protein
MYDDYDEFDHWRHKARFTGWAELSKTTRIDVRDSFHYTENPNIEEDIAKVRAEEPDEIIDTTYRKTREPWYRNTVTVDLTHQFGEYDSLNLGYRHYFLENDDPSYEDKERHNPYLGLTYWFTYQWGFGIQGSYTKGLYDDSDDFDQIDASARLVRRFSRLLNGFVQFGYGTIDYDGNSEDADAYIVSAGCEYNILEDISLSFDVGYAWLDRDESDDESTMGGNVALTKTFKKGVLYLTGSGGYKGPNYGAETLGISEFYEIGSSIRYQLTKYLSGNAFGSYRYDDYLEQTPDREDKTTKAGLGLQLRVLKWMSLGLNYEYRTVDSDLETEEYDENSVFFNVSLFPSRPFRTSRY